MAYKYREEIVGKRFLSLSGGGGGGGGGGDEGTATGRIGDWGWRSGVVRAATHRDVADCDLQVRYWESSLVLVEYDDSEWQRREWLSVHQKDGLFRLFMVERGLVWARREDPFSTARETVLWPALTFSSLVSKLDLPGDLQPVEFLVDRTLAFEDYARLKPYQVMYAS
ncbi:unnamed protein product [Phyllotreta striolata]|uniref:Uncharacterized protein n=1 Tax=Phyllotreta striolata TaxID=444603 RepID=A0A9N9TMR3_PHYSR|nr:unnamed protein product [Phyllotreta striolata]